MTKQISFDGIAPFYLKLSYFELDPRQPKNRLDAHIHTECEICIHLSGDIAFMVEKRLYPMLPGSIIITRPYEYHHCIYQSDAVHKHFWILFSAEGNESFLDLFFKRAPGENNLLIPTAGNMERLTALCREMLAGPVSQAENYRRFFTLIGLLQTAQAQASPPDILYPDVSFALDYLDKNLAAPVTIRALSDTAHVSVSTLERHFSETLGMTPLAYLRRKRLTRAAEFLADGDTVTEAGEKSGFSDCSAFIAQFKKTYGITPLKFQKDQYARHGRRPPQETEKNKEEIVWDI